VIPAVITALWIFFRLGIGNARAEVKNQVGRKLSSIHTNGMIEMSKQLSLKVALILFLSAVTVSLIP